MRPLYPFFTHFWDKISRGKRVQGGRAPGSHSSPAGGQTEQSWWLVTLCPGQEEGERGGVCLFCMFLSVQDLSPRGNASSVRPGPSGTPSGTLRRCLLGSKASGAAKITHGAGVPALQRLQRGTSSSGERGRFPAFLTATLWRSCLVVVTPRNQTTVLMATSEFCSCREPEYKGASSGGLRQLP